MDKPFTRISAAFLAFIAVVQLVRFLAGWEITINGTFIPVWASAVACVLVGLLAIMTWRELPR